VVAVEKAGIEQAEAIRQSLLFAYVTDRETYDQHDNESRILRAYTWSEGNARQGLVSALDRRQRQLSAQALWPEFQGGHRHPVDHPGDGHTAQVRFTKTWVSDGEGVPDRIGKFTATVTYRFEPSKQTALDLVWQNPTGFLVTDYRITAETLPPGGTDMIPP
jgi:type IV secretion system protein VirB8